jgi:hypothetical protein
MEAFKYAIDIDERRDVVVKVPTTVPVGKAEIVIIIKPLNNGQKKTEIDLAARGITPEQGADMRNRVISFEEDWNAPGMEVYDEL